MWFSARAVLEGGMGIALLIGETLVRLRAESQGVDIAVAVLADIPRAAVVEAGYAAGEAR